MLEKIFKKGSKKSEGKRVLLVEDDALLSKVLSQALSAEHFDVMVVDNGMEVVGAVKKFKPGIILLDLIIPGLDGFGVLKKIKEDEEMSKIPVAVLSNLSGEGDVKSVKVLGADDYFIKSNTGVDKIISYIRSKLK